MFLQTPKRPSLPPTLYQTPAMPLLPSLPPLSSILGNKKLPSIQFAPAIPPVVKTMDPASTPQLGDSKSWAFISHSPATYPSQEPSIDNAPLARRKRRRTSPNELSILNKEFEIGSTPNKQRRIEIAAKVLMTEKAVQIWFQNKRQLLRKHSNQEKEVTELPPTPMMVMPPMVMMPTPVFPLVLSTPTKPPLHKSNSYQSPQTLLPVVKPRAALMPVVEYDESNSSMDDSMIQSKPSLAQKRKLLEVNGSTMTFKLEPPLTLGLTLRLAAADKEARPPLADKTNNNNQCVEHLLKLKAGQWQ